MKDAVRVCCYQLRHDDDEPPAARTDRVLAQLEQLDTDLIVLPELWQVGFFSFDRYEAESEPLLGQTVSALRDLASRRCTHIHVGSFVERASDGRLFNTALLIDADGEIVLTYRKRHLYGHQSREPQLLTPGGRQDVVPTALGRVGLAICYDLRFPELFRVLSARGAEVLILCAAWPAARLEHWLLLTRARALENQAYVVACAAAGISHGTELSGNSVIVGPTGEIVARAPTEETLLFAELDLQRVRAFRDEFPVLRDRRVEDQLLRRKQS